MKPSELLELCMEFHTQGFKCSMDSFGAVNTFQFTLRVHKQEKSVFFEHADNDGSCFFNETQTQDAANWLRQKHDEFRGKA